MKLREFSWIQNHYPLFQIFATLVALASASPIEDTPEVAAAKAEFQAAFDAATAGEHAALAPAPVATAYLADAPEVAEAKAAFMKTFEDVEAGKVALPVAPVAPAGKKLFSSVLSPTWPLVEVVTMCNKQTLWNSFEDWKISKLENPKVWFWWILALQNGINVLF